MLIPLHDRITQLCQNRETVESEICSLMEALEAENAIIVEKLFSNTEKLKSLFKEFSELKLGYAANCQAELRRRPPPVVVQEERKPVVETAWKNPLEQVEEDSFQPKWTSHKAVQKNTLSYAQTACDTFDTANAYAQSQLAPTSSYTQQAPTGYASYNAAPQAPYALYTQSSPPTRHFQPIAPQHATGPPRGPPSYIPGGPPDETDDYGHLKQRASYTDSAAF